MNIRLLIVWLLWSCTAMSYANTYEPSAWTGQAVQPTYEFRSTSSYPSIATGSTYSPQVSTPFSSTPNNGPRKTEGWGWGNTDPEDDPVGEVPMGDTPYWLFFALALMYGVVRVARRNKRIRN